MRKELKPLMEIHTEDDFNYVDSYYSSVSDYLFMDVINSLIEDITYPVFIVKSADRLVYAVNEAARVGLNGRVASNQPFDSLVHVYEQEINQLPIVFFNHKWFLLSQDSFEFKGNMYLKIELNERLAVPDSITLDRWKNMIAVMLHRFRSPITGISGYLDLLKDDVADTSANKRVEKIEYGINQLCDIMDELEYLYHIPSKFDVNKLEPIEVTAAMNRVLLNCTESDRNRVKFLSNTSVPPVQATSESLEKVLAQLLKNALEHSSDPSSPVLVAVHANSIQISNEHPGITDDVREHLFFPFVTSRANNLGIGLTMALLFASQFGGTIFQTENGEKNRVTFTLLFP